ncbi:hypothetical protein QJS10_CPA01g01728 [Acorus calamus]|uniref:Uncharacterized protein n=1 Tax=Acorus calamus TaxID=4465 RepID=A0AAV9FNM9_ACOCL|nr:hypothetical protein QJS10_CPA01g01728 [Acorus calamus]
MASHKAVTQVPDVTYRTRQTLSVPIKSQEVIDKWDMDSPMEAAQQRQQWRHVPTLNRSGGSA